MNESERKGGATAPGERRTYALAGFGLLCAMGIVAFAHVTEVGSRYRSSSLPGVRLNVNSADAETLSLLPQIGPERARRIVQHRAEHGPFTSYAELIAVSGLGEKTVEGLIGYICFQDEGERR